MRRNFIKIITVFMLFAVLTGIFAACGAGKEADLSETKQNCISSIRNFNYDESDPDGFVMGTRGRNRLQQLKDEYCRKAEESDGKSAVNDVLDEFQTKSGTLFKEEEGYYIGTVEAELDEWATAVFNYYGTPEGEDNSLQAKEFDAARSAVTSSARRNETVVRQFKSRIMAYIPAELQKEKNDDILDLSGFYDQTGMSGATALYNDIKLVYGDENTTCDLYTEGGCFYRKDSSGKSGPRICLGIKKGEGVDFGHAGYTDYYNDDTSFLAVIRQSGSITGYVIFKDVYVAGEPHGKIEIIESVLLPTSTDGDFQQVRLEKIFGIFAVKTGKPYGEI